MGHGEGKEMRSGEQVNSLRNRSESENVFGRSSHPTVTCSEGMIPEERLTILISTQVHSDGSDDWTPFSSLKRPRIDCLPKKGKTS